MATTASDHQGAKAGEIELRVEELLCESPPMSKFVSTHTDP
jgi:hypothetical protein